MRTSHREHGKAALQPSTASPPSKGLSNTVRFSEDVIITVPPKRRAVSISVGIRSHTSKAPPKLSQHSLPSLKGLSLTSSVTIGQL